MSQTQLTSDKDTSLSIERFPMPLNGAEIVEIITKICADKLREELRAHQDLNEAKAFSRAEMKFGFGFELYLFPKEEGRKVSIHQEIELLPGMFPPDVLRILTGLEIWDQAGEGAAREDVKVEPKEQLRSVVQEKFVKPNMTDPRAKGGR